MNNRTLLLGTILLLATAVLSISHAALAAPTANRSADPVIITGADLTDFIGDNITDVVLYAYNGSWQAIPFQLDEKMIEPDDTEPDYVRFEDGLIDADDELVFMAQDAGSAETSWPNDSAARQHPRLAITLDDRLGLSSGVVYLFNSTTLARSSQQYVVFDAPNETIRAISYTVGFDTADFLGLSDLFLNGESADLLDRQKTRIDLGFFGTGNEEALTMNNPLTSIVTGPVRLIDGGDFGFAFYGARFETTVQANIEALEALVGGINIEAMRISFDQRTPAETNVTDYFDSNGVSATIDGSADANVTTALRDWYQISGGALGGFVATLPQLSITGGTISTYYEDDTTPAAGDTGDGLQYADSGVLIDNPSGDLEAQQIVYVLPPNTSSSIGAGFYQQATTPISTIIASESFVPTAISLHSQAATTAPQMGVVIFALLLTWCGWRKYRQQDHLA